MDYIVNNFAYIAELYIRMLAVVYFVFSSVLLAIWLGNFAHKKKSAYIAAGVFFVLKILYYLVPIKSEELNILTYVIILITYLVFWYLDSKRNSLQKLFLCILYYLIFWLTYEIATEISLFEEHIVINFDWYNSSVNMVIAEFFIWNFVDYVIAGFLMYAVIIILKKAYYRKNENLSWKEFIMLLAPFWTFLVVKPIIMDYFTLWMDGIGNGSIKENIPASWNRLLFCILSLISVLVIITLYQKIKESRESDYAAQALENRIEETKRHIEKVEEMYDQMRAVRHDMGNHLTVIEGLAEGGKNKELTEYISELKNRFKEIQPVIKTGNAVTDVVISEYYDLCIRGQINFESEFVYPSDLKINSFDMSVVLMNGLQNAYEAAIKTENPRIKIVSLVRERFFIISIQNTVVSEDMIFEDGLPVTTKTETGHGLGLKNIKAIARKYNGDIEIRKETENEGAIVKLNIMLMG